MAVHPFREYPCNSENQQVVWIKMILAVEHRCAVGQKTCLIRETKRLEAAPHRVDVARNRQLQSIGYNIIFYNGRNMILLSNVAFFQVYTSSLA